MIFTCHDSEFKFSWDVRADRAHLESADGGGVIWSGSLLPLFWLVGGDDDRRQAIKATFAGTSGREAQDQGVIELTLGDLGTGRMRVNVQPRCLQMEQLEVNWHGTPPRLVAMYVGTEVLTEEQRAAVPTLERPFWPNWQALGFVIPSAKTSPMQSFFRRWDFGHADIALGSFGPAMGTPYSAAFPRPLLAAGIGNDRGVVCLGAGDVPAAALTLQIRSSSGCLEWLYREDLWGGPADRCRRWEQPLRLCWEATAWQAYRRYFRSFDVPPSERHHAKAFMGTWGDFRLMRFDLRATVDRAVDELGGGQVLCIDDAWESFAGSGEVHAQRLPRLAEDLDYARSRGLDIGVWQSCGWIADFRRVGLTEDDVMLNRDGRPMRTNWALDPHDEPKLAFCLDPSSARARAFLAERTRRLMTRYRPALLKLDFSYGLPGPDACAPRDPRDRGERLGWTLLRTIAEAAKAVDPAVTILGYSLHPGWDGVQDLVALDDLGDAGTDEAGGHAEWSAWAALLGDRGRAIMGSSGYAWEVDTEVLLNTAVLGAPGMNLPRVRPDGSPPTPASLARRRAVTRWYRREARWEPLWLDSTAGTFSRPPQLRNWGRLEPGPDGGRVTVLALRDPTAAGRADARLRGLHGTGCWALLAQGDADVFTGALAVVPFAAGTVWIPRSQRPARVRAIHPGREDDWADWSWREGGLRLSVAAPTCGSDLLGLLVED
jgi:hypothetical protein